MTEYFTNKRKPAQLDPQKENQTSCEEKLWNLLGVLFYLCVAIGTVYHLILGH